jgi:hypothetical protein
MQEKRPAGRRFHSTWVQESLVPIYYQEPSIFKFGPNVQESISSRPLDTLFRKPNLISTTMKPTLIAILSLASLALSAPSSRIPRPSALGTATDSYVFSISIDQFISNRNAKVGPAELDWDSDGCSSSPDNPFGFDCPSPFPPSITIYILIHRYIVLDSCYRHDFGYRNFKKQARFTDANKARIDSNFKTDMFNQCRSETFQDVCEATATVYYEAVKAFGRKKAVEIRGVVVERKNRV